MAYAADPYKILGVARNATLPQVKTRYFELARKHHPDKLGDVSHEERCRNEEIFKEVTSAYSAIEHRIKTGGCNDTDSTPFTYQYPAGAGGEDWRAVWNDIESLFQNPGTWETMINIVKNTVADVTIQGVKKLRTHHIRIPVTLEEVHAKKKKRVRLFLAEMEDPIFTTIDIGEYPIMDIQHPDSNIPGLMIRSPLRWSW
jgi:DnaJ-class molecular chaperone